MIVYVLENTSIRECIIDEMHPRITLDGNILIFIYAGEKWHLKLPYDLIYLQKADLSDGTEIILQQRNGKEQYHLHFFPDSKSNYEKYQIKDHIKICLREDGDIIHPADFEIDTVMRQIINHGEITALNGTVVKQSSYQIGDCIMTLGMKILLGTDFLMISHHTGEIFLEHYVSTASQLPIAVASWTSDQGVPIPELIGSIELKEPKAVKTIVNEQMLSFMIPSIVMLSSTLLVGGLNAYRGYMQGREILDILPAVLLPGMMLLSILITQPMLQLHQKRKYLKEKKIQAEQYRLYLSQIKSDIQTNRKEYFKALYRNYPSCRKLLFDLAHHHRLVDRPYVCAGYSTQVLSLMIHSPHLSGENENISEMIGSWQQGLYHSVPFPVFLNGSNRVSIEGKDSERLFLSLLIQAGFYFKKIILITDEAFIARNPFVLRLPALNQGKMRNIHSHFDEITNLCEMIFQTTGENSETGSISLVPLENTDILIHVDKECWYRDVHTHKQHLMEPNLYLDPFPETGLEETGIVLKAEPSFYDLYSVGSAKDLSIHEYWGHHPNHQLRAAIGLRDSKDIIYLDLSEQRMGPHGLIAGMTGSGKSELILTLLLSLMVNYSPEDVQIALIDFKGGSICHTFEMNGIQMPHIIGILSNLDAENYDRVMYALKNECESRQKSFIEAGKKHHCAVMNLQDYRRIQETDMTLPKMADLVLVVDEFAELKSQSYEMLTQMISIARIGRSLGIHLILSTQKPSGVVNDQIWANTRFKICLKVSEKQDSMEVLHTDDAVGLKNPGEFILQWDGNKAKGICGYSGYRKSKNKISLQTIQWNGNTVNNYDDYGDCAEPAIQCVCKEIIHAWNGRELRKLWKQPLEKCNRQELFNKHAVYQIDDYYHQQQPFETYQYSAHDHWCFLTNDHTVKKEIYQYCIELAGMDPGRMLYLIDAPEMDEQKNTEKYIFLQSQNIEKLIQQWKDPLMKKIVFIYHPGRIFKELLLQKQMHELLSHSQEYNLQFFFFLSESVSIPYHELSFCNHRICLKNDNTDDMSIFLGAHIKEPVKERNKGIIRKEHLLEICIASQMMDCNEG